MGSLNEFIEKGSVVMSSDRPDLWDEPASAEAMLRGWVRDIIRSNGEFEYIASGGYEVSRIADGDDVRWQLDRQVLSYDTNDIEDTEVFDWTVHSKTLTALH